MLPVNDAQEAVFDSNDDDNDDKTSFLAQCEQFVSHYPSAEFRIKTADMSENAYAFHGKFSNLRGTDVVHLANILIEGERRGWSEEQWVIACAYFNDHDDEDTIANVEDGEYHIESGYDEDEAYEAYGRHTASDEISSCYEDYVDWQGIGRNNAIGCIEFNGTMYAYCVF